jgi:hypothetical protein
MPALGSDVPFQGTTLFKAIESELSAFISGTGISDVEQRRDFALAVGVFGHAFNAALADRFVPLDNPPGRSAELLRQFLKLNVTHWWTEVARRAMHMALSAFLGQKLRKSFAEIDPAFASSLSQYGMNARKWDMARAAIGVLPTVEAPSEAELHDARSGLDAWVDDRLIAVALGFDETSHARFIRGAADFTAEGELLRFMAQFRFFRAPFLPKPHGTPDVLERDRTKLKAMADGDGLPALANHLIWT